MMIPTSSEFRSTTPQSPTTTKIKNQSSGQPIVLDVTKPKHVLIKTSKTYTFCKVVEAKN